MTSRLTGGSASSAAPRFSIVTSSLNQAHFLEATLRSVRDQQRDDVEHIVIDGGSTDGSVALLEQHDDSLAYWVSAPDGGQPNAWNEGVRRARGQFVGFLNSDDLYLPGALHAIDRLARATPAAEWLIGGTQYFGEGGGDLCYPGVAPTGPADVLYFQTYAPQPGHFFARTVFDRVGTFDESLQYCFDFDFLVRCALARVPVAATSAIVAGFRFHDASKTMASRDRQLADTRLVEAKHYPAVEALQGADARRARARYHGFLMLGESRSALVGGRRGQAWRLLARTVLRYPIMLGTRAFVGTVQRLLGLRADN